MQTIIALLFLIFSLSFCVLLVLNLISRILHKNKRSINSATLVSLVLALGSFLLLTGDLSSALLMLGLILSLAFCICLLILFLRGFKGPKNKVLRWTTLFLFLFCISSFQASSKISNLKRETYASHELNEVEEGPTQTSLDFEIRDGDDPAEIKYYQELFHGVQVYDADYLHLIPFLEPATYEDCHKVLQANPDISSEFKSLLDDYLVRLENHYPELPLKVLYHNLKTLKVETLSDIDYLRKSMSLDSLGCYRLDENAIYIPANTVYKEGEFGYQALTHEFCHASRDMRGMGEEDSHNVFFQELGSDCLLNEAMNSVFSCTILNYYEWDIAYQMPSNYLRVMLECMDNYEIEDYFRHGESWFYDKLDSATGYTNYGRVIWKLISLQRNDWKQDKIELPPETYDPIYNYLCDMYFDRYITDTMTAEERMEIADELVKKVFYDAPEGYSFRQERIYENLEMKYGNEE